jgi:exodeoxyribonuclease-3
MARVEEWLEQVRPDVLCMQETKLADAAFPAVAFSGLGYESFHVGQGQWNGVAILSRIGIESPSGGFAPGLAGSGPVDEYVAGVLGEARLATATCGGVRISSVYVPNGRTVDDPHYGAKLEWLLRLRQHLEATSSPDQPVIVAGDFNIAPEDRDVWDASAFVGSTHVTPAERERLRELLDWGLIDAFRARYDDDRLYTYWDYRAGDFHQHRGMRIDLVLATRPVVERLSWALVDRIARKGKGPSDHAPVVIELASAPIAA